MPKILHIACVSSAKKSSGVCNQMQSELDSAKKQQLPWRVEVWAPDPTDHDVTCNLGSWCKFFFIRRFIFWFKLKKSIAQNDKVILRYMPLDFMTLLISKKQRKKVVLCIHTTRKGYWQSNNLLQRLMSRLDTMVTGALIRNCNAFIGVTDQIIQEINQDFQLSFQKNFLYPNGVFFPDNKITIDDNREGTIKIAFIASRFYHWNGLELLLSEIAANGSTESFELHLVGELSDHQKSLVSKLGKQVRVHDSMDVMQIRALLATIDVTLGAFSLDRVGLKNACTLKIRESLSSGTPVYSGHVDVAFDALDYFYFHGGTNISEIVRFAKDMRRHSKQKVFNDSRARIDKDHLLSELYVKLQNV